MLKQPLFRNTFYVVTKYDEKRMNEMKKATKRKIALFGIFFNMILGFTACGLCNKSTFIGNEIANTDFYDVDFEQMNSTRYHKIDMDAGESIKVKIISKSGKISVQIYNEDDQPVYRGDDVTGAEFEIQIDEKGTYRLCVSGKDAKGHVIFSRCREEKDIKNE